MAALAVSDALSNSPEQLEAVAKAIGRSKSRKAVFQDVYHGKTRVKRVADIARRTGLTEKEVLGAGKYLVDHHVINQVSVAGRVAYEKVGFFHKNKAKILGYVENPNRLKKIATKRRPATVAMQSIRTMKKAELRKRKRLVVLFLTANPDPAYPLRVDAEMRRVQEAIRGSKFRDQVQIEYRPAADLTSILDGLNDLKPQIVHFSGHGDPAGLAGDAGTVLAKPNPSTTYDTHISYELLAKALAATDSPPAVLLLNSCWGSKGEKALRKVVRFLISMNAPISDLAAAVFAPRFYAAIASGQSLKASFDQAVLAVEAASISDASTPELLSDEDPAAVLLT